MVRQRLPKKKKSRWWWFLLSLLLAALSFIGLRFYDSIKQSRWDGQHRFNLLLADQSVMIFSLVPDEESIRLLLIPANTLVEVINGHGEYQVGSVFDLGQLENQGAELLVGTIQEFLGVPIDGYALVERGLSQEFNQEQLIGLLKNRGVSDLTNWDLVRLWWQLKKIRQDKIKTIDLATTTVSSEKKLVDDSLALEIDGKRIDQIVSRFFKDQAIRNEDLAISVLNATDYSGLAHQGLRLITNIGGQVVNTGEVSEPIDRCLIKSGLENKESYTVQKVKKVFDCDLEVSDLAHYRAKVVLILGKDYWRRLNEGKLRN